MSKYNYFQQTLAGWELEVRRGLVHIGTIREGEGAKAGAYQYFKGPHNQQKHSLTADTVEEMKQRVEASDY